MGDALKDGFYILLFLPGFIFVQTRDYHILRGPKGQLEKTLEIVLWSAAIWGMACATPLFWPLSLARTHTLEAVYHAITVPVVNVPIWASVTNRDGVAFFASVCGWTYLGANIWGFLRRTPLVDGWVKRVVKRDWYPSVSLRFFSENVDRVIAVQTDHGLYIGTLRGAPDTVDDSHILLTNVYLLLPGTTAPEKLAAVDGMLLKIDDVQEISVYDKRHHKKDERSSYVTRVTSGASALTKKAWSRSHAAVNRVTRGASALTRKVWLKSHSAVKRVRGQFLEQVNGRQRNHSTGSGQLRRGRPKP